MKWIYLARRGPAIARDDFVMRWRGHARLAARFPELAGFFTSTIYCHLSAAADADYDALGILELVDGTAIASILNHPDAVATMHPDERLVFEDLIASLSLAGEDHVLTDGPFGRELGVVLLQAPAATAEQVDAAVASVAFPGRCVVDHVRPGVFPTRHRWTAVIELHGEDRAVCAAAALATADAVRGLGAIWCGGGPAVLRWQKAG